MDEVLLVILIPTVIVGLVLVLIGVLIRATNGRKNKEAGFDARFNGLEVRLLQLEASEEASAVAMNARFDRMEELLEEIQQEMRVV